jgi:hypothetical protein
MAKSADVAMEVRGNGVVGARSNSASEARGNDAIGGRAGRVGKLLAVRLLSEIRELEVYNARITYIQKRCA